MDKKGWIQKEITDLCQERAMLDITRVELMEEFLETAIVLKKITGGREEDFFKVIDLISLEIDGILKKIKERNTKNT